ncbi:MAG: hypothetical protein ACRCXZ_02850 [Patescibacteria group bacterium]
MFVIINSQNHDEIYSPFDTIDEAEKYFQYLPNNPSLYVVAPNYIINQNSEDLWDFAIRWCFKSEWKKLDSTPTYVEKSRIYKVERSASKSSKEAVLFLPEGQNPTLTHSNRAIELIGVLKTPSDQTKKDDQPREIEEVIKFYFTLVDGILEYQNKRPKMVKVSKTEYKKTISGVKYIVTYQSNQKVNFQILINPKQFSAADKNKVWQIATHHLSHFEF